jgi:hypothetical protein
MKKDTGFVLLKTDNNPTSNVIFKTISSFIADNPYLQILLFNSVNNRVSSDNVPILHLNQAKFFDGNLVIFDTMSLLFAKNFPNIDTIFMYASTLFWSKESYSNYLDIESLFTLKNLEFIASNREMHDIYETCWKKPIGICENFNYETLKTII